MGRADLRKQGFEGVYDMENIKKNFGFGCMRLPMDGENVNPEETKKMADAFLDAGFNYFDTAHGCLQGKSETALKACVIDPMFPSL